MLLSLDCSKYKYFNYEYLHLLQSESTLSMLDEALVCDGNIVSGSQIQWTNYYVKTE